MSRILSPGKFEGEPDWVPDFWDRAGDSKADEDDGEVYTFYLDDEDRREYPELVGVEIIELWESDQGFVYHRVYGPKPRESLL